MQDAAGHEPRHAGRTPRGPRTCGPAKTAKIGRFFRPVASFCVSWPIARLRTPHRSPRPRSACLPHSLAVSRAGGGRAGERARRKATGQRPRRSPGPWTGGHRRSARRVCRVMEEGRMDAWSSALEFSSLSYRILTDGTTSSSTAPIRPETACSLPRPPLCTALLASHRNTNSTRLDPLPAFATVTVARTPCVLPSEIPRTRSAPTCVFHKLDMNGKC